MKGTKNSSHVINNLGMLNKNQRSCLTNGKQVQFRQLAQQRRETARQLRFRCS